MRQAATAIVTLIPSACRRVEGKDTNLSAAINLFQDLPSHYKKKNTGINKVRSMYTAGLDPE